MHSRRSPPGCCRRWGVLFGLLVIFTAAGVWGDIDRANSAVNREASALRSVVLLAASFPGEPEERLRDLVRRYIDAAAAQEWPMMARHAVSLTIAPGPLAEALQFDLSLTTQSHGQETAQREIATAIENALDARRLRIIVSLAQINWVKWSCLILPGGRTAGGDRDDAQ